MFTVSIPAVLDVLRASLCMTRQTHLSALTELVEKLPTPAELRFERAKVELLPWSGIFTSCALGFTLSLLFFMDQNISAAMVNAPQNK